MLGIGEPWPIYLEGKEECYILEPLVIRGLSHSVNLGISFLMRNNLKLICTEDEVALMLVKDSSASRMPQLCHSEVREGMESNQRAKDFNPSLENST